MLHFEKCVFYVFSELANAPAEPSHNTLGQRGGGLAPGRGLQTQIHVCRRSEPLQEMRPDAGHRDPGNPDDDTT